ncbi:MAG: hypothetical protein KDJ29_04465, partial [Hyphomicrobiales bacterium]|nr:hypothetical protein [Hyphomicrobiales bacterium]
SEIAEVMAAMADGLFWRRAIKPGFDAVTIGRTMLAMLAAMLRPTPGEEPLQTELSEDVESLA